VKSLEGIYNEQYYRQRINNNAHIPIMCAGIIKVLQPKSIIDVGCAIGNLVEGFYGQGIEAVGIEGCKNAIPYMIEPDRIIIHDLRKPWTSILRYSLAVSFEVAEHIEPEYTLQYINTLCLLSNRILCSAAQPGQPGTYHVNCQPREYWIDLFNDESYQNKPEIEQAIKEQWEAYKDKSPYNNLLYFEKIK
jgi:hypothetical protein